MLNGFQNDWGSRIKRFSLFRMIGTLGLKGFQNDWDSGVKRFLE